MGHVIIFSGHKGYVIIFSGHASCLAQLRALEKKANRVEKQKIKKDGSQMWTEVYEIGDLIRSGKVRGFRLVHVRTGREAQKYQFWQYFKAYLEVSATASMLPG